MNLGDPPRRPCVYVGCENEATWVCRFWRWQDGTRTDVGVLRSICEEHRHPLHDVHHAIRHRADVRAAHRTGGMWNEDVELVEPTIVVQMGPEPHRLTPGLLAEIGEELRRRGGPGGQGMRA